MSDERTTIRAQLQEVLENGDSLESVVCLYRPHHDKYSRTDRPPIVRCSGAELPERKFDAGFGGVNGEATICFSATRVYIRAEYDGSEWFQAIPRNPENVGDDIPSVGGS